MRFRKFEVVPVKDLKTGKIVYRIVGEVEGPLDTGDNISELELGDHPTEGIAEEAVIELNRLLTGKEE